jgi:hypothetical protein
MEIEKSYERTVNVANHSGKEEDKYETIRVAIKVKEKYNGNEELGKVTNKLSKFVKKYVNLECNKIIHELENN